MTASLLYVSPQTQLPQQKLQLQEACTRKEKNVAVLEHQLMEVEVRVSAWQSPGWGVQAVGASVNCVCLSAPQETVRQFRGAVGEQLGKMRVFLAALEGSLDREAERVRNEAGVALRRELGHLNSYLEQLRQMDKVLEQVADKPQTEFLTVSTEQPSLSVRCPGFRPYRPHSVVGQGR